MPCEDEDEDFGKAKYRMFIFDTRDEYQNAINVVTRMINRDGANSILLHNRGILQWECGLRKEAMQDLVAAIVLSPVGDVESFMAMGEYCGDSKQTTAALVAFMAAAAIAPADVQMRLFRAYALHAAGFYDMAVSDYRAFIDSQVDGDKHDHAIRNLRLAESRQPYCSAGDASHE